MLARLIVLALAAIAGCGSTEPSGPSPAAASSAAFDAPRWKVGTRYRYAIELGTRASLGEDAAHDFGFDLHAVLELWPQSGESAQSELFGALRDVRMVPGRAQPAEALAQLSAELAKPFAWSFEGGVLKQQRFAPGLCAQSVAILRTLTSAMQLTPPPSAEAGSWRVEEYDSAGRYEAEYRRTASGIERRKQRYLAQLISGTYPGAAPVALMPRVRSSSTTLSVEHGALASVTLSEQVESQLAAGKALSVTTTLAVRLTDAQAAAEPPGRKQLAEAGIALRADEAHAVAPREDRFDQERIAGRSVQQVLRALAASPRARAGRRETAQADSPEDQAQQRSDLESFAALVALLRQEPSALAVVVTEIERDGRITGTLIDALANAGSERAQHELCALVKQTNDAALRRQAAGALIRVKRPSIESVETLAALGSDRAFAEHSDFGLGTAARNLREQGELERARAIRDLLTARLAAAADRSARIRVLRGFSNSGDPSALPAVQPFFADQDREVRRAAVDALLLMRGDEVDTVLAEVMARDEDQFVRLAALKATSERPASSVLAQALSNVGLHAREPVVRHGAVDVMKKWLPARPELRAALAEIARDEQAPRTRELASSALATHRD